MLNKLPDVFFNLSFKMSSINLLKTICNLPINGVSELCINRDLSDIIYFLLFLMLIDLNYPMQHM